MGKKKKNRIPLKDLSKLAEDEGLYFNRELSWIKFNERILAEAANPNTPLLERVNFFSIVSGNFDEFFQVRVPEYQKNSRINSEEFLEVAGSVTTLEMIYSRVIALMRKASTLWRKELAPELDAKGIHIITWADCTRDEKENLLDQIKDEEYTILRGERFTDLRLDEHLEGFALLAETRNGRAAVPIQNIIDKIGRYLPVKGRTNTFVLIEDMLRKYAEHLFDEDVYAVMPVRLTREAEKVLKGDDADDIIFQEQKLSDRLPSRLETPEELPFGYTAHLVSALDLVPELVFDTKGPLGASDLKEIPVEKPELHFPKFTPGMPKGLEKTKGLFDAISKKDRILFTPYQSFDALVNFLKAAGEDENVTEISMTLYRLGSKSPVVEALINAAEAGKKVTAVIELKASFDEERNFLWSEKLKKAGVDVIFGVSGLKTHAKCCIVSRNEEVGTKYYATVSTGNYNAGTARIYSDLSLFTADDRICSDLRRLFSQIKEDKISGGFESLIVSPKDMEKQILELIEREADSKGHIILKMNSLTDKTIINALYAASQKGVKIELCVRGICMLRPGVEGLSENISVVSVVGRFLEHARVFYFEKTGRLYIGSPDMMPRNLHKRVEILCPVYDADCRSEIERLLSIWLSDKVKGYSLDSAGRYFVSGKNGISSQEQFISMMKQ
ncbi:MAG TPA: polyphosphate kinase 1 [Methanocorpusculum sp.]|jgi:polyphosphate kinase|nr:polyphosphate kinase 1 [Methanocorpusculum sp.]HJJ80535.1 polyphosphate kinase 1 [Methanocorpusculum sp.]